MIWKDGSIGQITELRLLRSTYRRPELSPQENWHQVHGEFRSLVRKTHQHFNQQALTSDCYQILQGEGLATLATLPDASVCWRTPSMAQETNTSLVFEHQANEVDLYWWNPSQPGDVIPEKKIFAALPWKPFISCNNMPSNTAGGTCIGDLMYIFHIRYQQVVVPSTHPPCVFTEERSSSTLDLISALIPSQSWHVTGQRFLIQTKLII